MQGNTVAAMGSFKGLKQVRRIVEDCIQNKMHPVYHIKVIYLYIRLLLLTMKFVSTECVWHALLPILCCRFSWWRRNLKKIQHLLMRIGIGFSPNLRSMIWCLSSIPLLFLLGYPPMLKLQFQENGDTKEG